MMLGAKGAATALAAALVVSVPAHAAVRPEVATSRPRAAPVAWVLPSTVRVSQTQAAERRTWAVIEAVRGETESFQVAVRAVGGPLRNVGVAVSTLLGPGGAAIGGPSLATFREHYVPVRRHSPDWSGAPIDWPAFPDALIPTVDSVTGRPPLASARYRPVLPVLAAGRNQPFWVDVTVPGDAPAGTYVGSWTISTDLGARRGRVSLVVRAVTLPATPASASRFGIWQAANRTPAVENLLHRYRVQAAAAPPARPTGDFVLGARAAAVADDIAGSSTPVDLGFWSGADAETCTMAAAPTQEALRAAAAAFPAYSRLYVYGSDEVTLCSGLTPQLAEWARALHAAGVEHLVTVRPRADLMDDGTGRPIVDIWVLTPWQLRELGPTLKAQVLAAGGELWSYQALVQGSRTPSWQLDFPVTSYRLLGGFLNASQGATGLLYWAVDRWQRNPWTDPTYTHTTSCCYPGDGQLVYPGRDAGVVGVTASVRLAMVRDGMDDYDYVALLRARGQGAAADRIVARAARSWSSWTSDGRVLAGVRHQLLDLLETPAP